MPNGNQLNYSITAVNASQKALNDAAGDLGKLETASAGAEEAAGQLDSTWDRLQAGVDELGNSLDNLSEKIDHDSGALEGVADAAGSLEQVLIGTKDILGVLGEQFGVPLGPMEEWSQAAADVAGGVESVITGGTELVKQFAPMVAGLGPVITATWAHVAALTAQAAAFIVANAPILLLIAGLALLAGGLLILVRHWDDIQPHIQPVVDFFNNTVVPAANAVWEKGLKPVVDFVTDHWKEIGTLLLAPLAPVLLVVNDGFGIRTAAVNAFQAVLDFVTDHWKEIGTLLLAPLAPVILIASDAFGIRSKTIEALNGLIADVVGLFDKIKGAGEGMGSALKDGFIAGVKGLVSVTGSVVEGILDAIKFLINSAVDTINNLIPNEIGFDVGAFGVSKHISIPLPDNPIPHLADGGIVRARPGGTLALLGEGGRDEAVIPLVNGAPTAGQTVVHVHVQGSIWSVDELAYELQRRGFVTG
ncbi:MAG: hypothetical protein AB7N24_17360 [Dehalococcoidia bacterium]